MDDGEISQTQKIELEQSQFFQDFHGILRDDDVVIFLQRYQLHDGKRRDQHTSSVGGSVPRHTLQLHCHVQQLMRRRIRFIEFAQLCTIFFFRHCLGNGVSWVNVLGNLIAQGIGNAQRTSGVLYRSTCFEKVERDDLRDTIGTVFGNHIFLYFLAAFYAKIS